MVYDREMISSLGLKPGDEFLLNDLPDTVFSFVKWVNKKRRISEVTHAGEVYNINFFDYSYVVVFRKQQ